MPIGDLLAQITGEPSPTQPSATLPPKRKAESGLRKPADKIQKMETTNVFSPRPVGQANRNKAVEASSAKIKLKSNTYAPISSPTATFKNGQPTPPPTDTPAGSIKPPKKGSFAEIMARGKAAQSTLGQIGKIQHKKIEKVPSKREREEMKTQKSHRLEKNTGSNGKFRNTVQHTLNGGSKGVRVDNTKVALEPEKKTKKAAVASTGYAGTARPRPGGSNNPSRSSASASSSRYDKSSSKNRYADDQRGPRSKRHASEDEDDEEEYYSDVSSDMEAAAYEVDEEEAEAGRIARREDAEALADENRHKQEKEEKRRRLLAMAKSRR